MLYGTAPGDEFAVSQACPTDAFIGHVHLPRAYVQLSAMRLIYARFCFVFTGFEDAVRHRLWGSIWCFASMPHGRIHRPCPRIRAYMSSYPPCVYISMLLSMLLLCFYGFRRCCTAPPLGINLARLGLEFCWGSAVSQACLTDAFIGHVHLRAYMSSYPPCAYISMLLSMFAVFLRVSKMLYGTASGMNLSRLGLEFCWGSAVSQACLTDAFIGHVHLCPALRHGPIIALCLRVLKMLHGTASGDVVTFRLAPLANNLSDLRIVAHAHPTLLSLLFWGSAAWAVALKSGSACCAEGQAICGFSHGGYRPHEI